MKKLLTIAMALFVIGATAFAQENKEEKHHKGSKREAEKIGFITQRLDLTPEEAQVFWPVYNQYAKEAKESNKAVREARKNLCPEKGQPDYTEAQAKEAINTYIKAVEVEKALLSKYNTKFLKVLPAQKVAKLYLAEEQFRTKMLKELYQRQGHKKNQEERQRPNFDEPTAKDRPVPEAPAN